MIIVIPYATTAAAISLPITAKTRSPSGLIRETPLIKIQLKTTKKTKFQSLPSVSTVRIAPPESAV